MECKNFDKTKGIYNRLLEYVPSVDGKLYPTVVYGDGLSCERGKDAQKAMCNGLTQRERLEGLEPSAQEFHKEMLLLQDHYNEFFHGASTADKGTMFYIKNVFNFRTVKKEIGNCFTDAWEMMCFTTEAYVCLLAMNILGMRSIDDIPNGIPANEEEYRDFLKTTAKYVVGTLSHKLDTELLLTDEEKNESFQSEATRKRGKKRKLSKSAKQMAPEESEDFKLNYNRALTWRGLNLMCRRDAVREGDGDAMMKYWRMDLTQFFAKGHTKYIILAHRLLCATNGWLSEKIKKEIIWNRTVNYSGGIGRNLPMDLMNEMLNRSYKDMLEGAKGRYTEETIQRCGQIVGPLGESLDRVFDTSIVENDVYRHRKRAQNRDKNVSRLINMMLSENPFSKIVGRRYRAYSSFRHSENPKLPNKFLGKIQQLSKKIDRLRDSVLNR